MKVKLIPFNKLPPWIKAWSKLIIYHVFKKQKESKFDCGFEITYKE